MIIELSNKITKFERTKYSLLTMIGDVGGFNSAIALAPGYLMSVYSTIMFRKSLASHFPIRKNKKTLRSKHAFSEGKKSRMILARHVLHKSEN